MKEKYNDVARKMAGKYPPTNRRLLLQTAVAFEDEYGINDPIVQSILSWIVYLSNDGVSQLDAGMTMNQHEALQDRLAELGLEPGPRRSCALLYHHQDDE